MTDSKLPSVHLAAILKSLYSKNSSCYIKRLPAQLHSKSKHTLQAKIVHQQISSDNTVKWLLRFDVGTIETVLIRTAKRNTVCVSSQVGCAMGCTFCATGKLGWSGNLTCRQILEQIIIANNYLDNGQVTNVVFMGMGEPMLNLDVVLDACAILCDDNAFGLSYHRVTISTVGLVPGIRKLIGRTKVSLALSLHAANNDIRKKLIPIARKYTIEQTLNAVAEYLDYLGKKRYVFIEYTMIAGHNDSLVHAQQLVQALANIRAKINLIPCNPVTTSLLSAPNAKIFEEFASILHKAGFIVTIRQPKGNDIYAACGQLSLQMVN